MNGLRFITLIFFASLLVFFTSCEKDVPDLFSLADEKELGSVLDETFENDSSYVILSRSQYTQSYSYADTVLQQLVNAQTADSSFLIDNRESFDWKITIIRDSEIHAFASTGGNLYVTTGMIKVLETVDQFAGLVAHFVSHMDERDITKQLLNEFSSPVLKAVSKGENIVARTQIATFLSSTKGLKFGVYNENRADEVGVEYLAVSVYSCGGGRDMISRMIKQQQQGIVPKFLQLHAGEADRIERLNEKIAAYDCGQQLLVESGFKFKDFQNSLLK